MTATAEKADPALWDKVKKQVMKSDKGGRKGQWSARKAQLAVHDYKAEGGTYRGRKTADNHLVQWTDEDWGTKSGRKSLKSGERYLPREAREKLSDSDYKRTTQKKRADTKKGRQFSSQPADVARKVAPTRAGGVRTGRLQSLTRAELMQRAQKRNIAGRSRMKKEELVAALRRH